MATTPPSALLKPTSVEPAEPAARNRAEEGSPKNKRSALRWVLPGVGALVLLAAAAGFYIVRYRRGGSLPGAAASFSRKSSPAEAKDSKPPVKVDLPLDPFVVNLADAGGHSYARIGLTLHLTAPGPGKEGAASEKQGSGTAAGDLGDMARDQIIGVLNRQQSSDLLAPDGKEQLKRAIEAAIAAKNPQVRVIEIYFTEFLVQS